MIFFTFPYLRFTVHDSTGKLNSGILNGNINQFGDFDQCLGVKHQMKAGAGAGGGASGAAGGASGEIKDEIKGQYCLAYAQPVLPHKSKRLQTFFKLVQSHGPFRSEFNDVSRQCNFFYSRFFFIYSYFVMYVEIMGKHFP